MADTTAVAKVLLGLVIDFLWAGDEIVLSSSMTLETLP